MSRPSSRRITELRNDGLAAIDDQRLAGHQISGVRTQEERCLADALVQGLFGLDRWSIVFLGAAGRDGIDQDIFRGQFAGRLSSHADDGRFAGRMTHCRRIAGRRCQVDDASAALVGHDPSDQLHAEKDAGDVDLNLAPPFPFVDGEHGFSFEDAGGVDQNMNAAKGVAGLFDHAGGLEAVGDVSAQGDRVAALVLDFLCKRFGAFNVEVIDSDGRAMFGQRQSNGPPATGAGARHQGMMAA